MLAEWFATKTFHIRDLLRHRKKANSVYQNLECTISFPQMAADIEYAVLHVADALSKAGRRDGRTVVTTGTEGH